MATLRRFSISISALMLVTGCAGEAPRACTLIGCGPVLETSLDLGSESAGLTVEACFNDECQIRPAPAPNTGAGIELAGGKLTLSVSNRESKLHVSWNAAPSLAVANDDRYGVRVTTQDGDIVAESVVLAKRYGRSYPNGKDCDGDGCLQLEDATTLR